MEKVGARYFEQNNNEGLVSIHGSISPAEIYSSDSINAHIKHTSGSKIEPCQVYRLSPLGVELIVDKENHNNINLGEELDIELVVGQQTVSFIGIKVASVILDNNHLLIGFRWCADVKYNGATSDRRINQRWTCGDHYSPTGISPNPARFNDFIYFSVKDISKTGMLLMTSLRNKFLIKGMILESNISLPLIGQIQLKLKIVNARLLTNHGKEQLALGVEFVDADSFVTESIGQYLLQFGPVSVQELKSSGLTVTSTDAVVDYKYVKTANDYKQVLELRRLAYSAVGKADPQSNIESMSDIYDAKSRILMAVKNGTTIGSHRITFHTPEEKNEYEEFVTLPQSFPRRDEVLVLSRICTNPEYRGSDLFYGLFRQCILSALQSKRRYILGGCTDDLLPLYKKIGFKPQGIFFEHGNLKGVKEQIIMADALGIISGKDVDMTVWNAVYHDLAEYMTTAYEVPFDPGINLRLNTYKTLAPLTRLFSPSVRLPKSTKPGVV